MYSRGVRDLLSQVRDLWLLNSQITHPNASAHIDSVFCAISVVSDPRYVNHHKVYKQLAVVLYSYIWLNLSVTFACSILGLKHRRLEYRIGLAIYL